MPAILDALRQRNQALFYFGIACLVAALVFLLLSKISSVTVNNVSAWHKPFKFAASIGIYALTMGWFSAYLKSFDPTFFNVSVIVLLSFEIVYIALQAGRGQLSHFNTSTPVTTALYAAMGIAATIVTLYTAYIGLLFMGEGVVALPTHELWAIRAGIFIFVIFSLEGFVMGSRLSHTIGGPDGGPGLPLLHWSTRFGDPRIAHFIGMHALQVLPLAAHFLVKNVNGVAVLSVAYIVLATYTLVVALQGRPAWGSV